MWIQSKNILFIKSILVPTNQGRSIRMLDFQGIICNRDVVHKQVIFLGIIFLISSGGTTERIRNHTISKGLVIVIFNFDTENVVG